VNSLRRVAWSVALATVMFAVVVSALTACDADGSAERPPRPASSTPLSQTDDPSGDPSSDPTDEPTGGFSTPVSKPHRAPMPEVPMRYMYARGEASEGVLVSAAGITETGRSASAYVPTRTGAVFASGDQVYDLVDGGTAVAIGPVPELSVFLQVDPTLRYVAWELRRADGLHARALVYDVVAHRMVLDRVLLWGDRTSPLRMTSFGAARLRLVHLPRWGFWTFATLSGHSLAAPGGQVVDLRSHRVEGPRVSRGVWSPGLRYSASEARGRRPWQVVDLTTGRDVTPAALLGPTLHAAHLTGWLGNATFGLLTSSGTWRHSSVAASVCRVAGRCRVVWRLHPAADDSGLQRSNEIG
jgi:hypothetical protein